VGKEKVEGVRLQDVNTGGEKILDASGIFIFVGLRPDTDFLQGAINLDKDGFIVADEDMRTNIEGVFACGDCRKKTLRQIVTACAEGAVAGFIALKFAEEIKT